MKYELVHTLFLLSSPQHPSVHSYSTEEMYFWSHRFLLVSPSLIIAPWKYTDNNNTRYLGLANQSVGAAWILRAAAAQCIWCVTFCFVLPFYCCCGNRAKIAATAVLLNNHQCDSSRCVIPSLGKKKKKCPYLISAALP